MCNMGVNSESRLMELSDCVMMTILSYLDATSLYNLSKTCTYFKNIVEDKKLWRYVDCRSEPNSDDKVKYCCDRLNEKTTHALFRAQTRKIGLFPTECFNKVANFDNLVILALENQRFCGKSLLMKDFPKNLEELSLKATQIRNGERFFQHSSAHMSKLRVLIVDECGWIDSSFIMSIAKYPSLEILSIIKCNKLHYNVVPYLSVARHAYKKLKILDCRFSTVGNDFLRAFDKKENILAMYFQSMRSYQMDTGRPLLRSQEDVYSITADDMNLINQSIICNRSLHEYKYCTGGDIEELPKSVLYMEPYPECTCKYSGFHESQERLKEDEIPKPMMCVDDFMDFHNPTPQKFICKKHVNEVQRLPTEFRDFFIQNQKQFHADSDSDDDSDFDSDAECCMYGMGRAQQMIVLKVRSVDGTLPEPEVFNIDPQVPSNPNSVITVDLFHNQNTDNRVSNTSNAEPQPSTSKESGEERGEKRKNDETLDNTEFKKTKTDEPLPSTSQPNTSKTESSSKRKGKRSKNDEDDSTESKKKKDKDKSDDEAALYGCCEELERAAAPNTSKEPVTPSKLTDYEKKMLQDIPHLNTIQKLIDPTACLEAHFCSYDGVKHINRVYSQETLKAALGENNENYVSSESNSEESSQGSQGSGAGTSRDGDESEENASDNSNEAARVAGEENVNNNDDRNENVEPEQNNEPVVAEPVNIPVPEEIDNVPNVPEREHSPASERSPSPELVAIRHYRRDPKRKLKLRHLSLRGYRKITDKALKYLRNLNIDLLDLTHTSVSVEGIECFLSYNPDCRIIHKNFCVCKPRLP